MDLTHIALAQDATSALKHSFVESARRGSSFNEGTSKSTSFRALSGVRVGGDISRRASKYSQGAAQPTFTPVAGTPGEKKCVIPSCPAVAIKFNDISVDVKIEDVSEESKSKVPRFCRRLAGQRKQSAQSTKRILHGVSGCIKPYKLVALMGASGAGKSTLLNVLSRRITQSEGLVCYNETAPTESIVQGCSAFVQQLDLFLDNITVDEHLTAQMKLRLPSSTSNAEIKSRMESLCNQMSLVKCRSTVIGGGLGPGGLSGGEKKRLNVASELITSPSVLFADEPTTGLDSFMADSVVKVLRDLANSGRTVVATIHQPSSRIFDLFDELILLAEGRLIYAGDRLGCMEWLSGLGFVCPQFTNMADFIIKVVSMPEVPMLRQAKQQQIVEWSHKWIAEGDAFLRYWGTTGRERFLTKTQSFVDMQIDASVSQAMRDRGLSVSLDIRKKESFALTPSASGFGPNPRLVVEDEQSHVGSKSIVALDNESRPGWFKQMKILYIRASQANKRDKFLVHARAGQTIVLGLLFGLLFMRHTWTAQDARTKLGGIHFIIMNQAMSGAFAVCSTFTFEKPIINREHESGLISASAYMSAKMAADAPVQIVFPILFTLITYFLMDLNKDFGRFIVFTVVVLLVSNAAMSIGYMASAVAPNPDVATVVTNMSVLPLTMFGGLMVKLNEAPVWLSWIQYISYVKYGFLANSVTVFRGENVDVGGKLVPGLAYIEEALYLRESEFALCIVMLVVLVIAFRVIGCVAFSMLMKRTKENA